MCLRPIFPLIDYAVNYEKIVTELCINRNKPKSKCKGLCYLKDQMAKSTNESEDEKTTFQSTNLTDYFLLPYTIDLIELSIINDKIIKIFSYTPFHLQNSFSQLFRPPIFC